MKNLFGFLKSVMAWHRKKKKIQELKNALNEIENTQINIDD